MIKVLVVDDQAVLRLLLATHLKNHYHVQCVEADSAEQAIFVLKTSSFDLIISDQWMPKGNGTEIAEYLKESGTTTPFILFTSDKSFNFPNLVLKDNYTRLFKVMEDFGFFSKRSSHGQTEHCHNRTFKIYENHSPSAWDQPG